jgi:thiamine biosynthesis protein ThiS
MHIEVNGHPREVSTKLSIAELLRDLDIHVTHVAVERNLEIVPRAEHAKTWLEEGDRLEVVTLVGGG